MSKKIAGASVHGAGGRPGLRRLLALIAAADLAILGLWLLSEHPTGKAHPLAPHVLVALGSYPVVIAAALGVGLVCCLRFAQRRFALASGAGILIVSALFVEAQAAILGGPMRNFFYPGALLAGWMAGLGFARWLRMTDERAEQLAEAGACGVLAATYVSASLNKLGKLGAGFIDASTLRAIIVCHHDIDDTSVFGAYARAVVEVPWLGQALALATIVIQLGAVLYLFGPKLRMLWGSLLLGFHLNVLLLTHIPYVEPMVLLLAFSYPWGQGSREPVSKLRGAKLKHVVYPLGCVLIVAAGLWMTDLTAYTRGHHGAQSRAANVDTTQAVTPLRSFGPLTRGQPLAGGWTLQQILRRGAEVHLHIHHQQYGSVVIYVRDSGPHARLGPFSTANFDVGYRSSELDFAAFSLAGKTIQKALAGTSSSVAVLAKKAAS